jgi:hypothetical protein
MPAIELIAGVERLARLGRRRNARIEEPLSLPRRMFFESRPSMLHAVKKANFLLPFMTIEKC